jgi:hypothetical protein
VSSRITTGRFRPDEQVLDAYPRLESQVDARWRRRLNAFPGRTLTDRGLTGEHAHRTGHLSTHGRLLTPGVIAGLHASASPGGAQVEVEPGFGISAEGEDVSVIRPLTVPIADLYAYLPPEGAEPEPGANLGELSLVLRGPLSEIGTPGIDLPAAFILILEPIVAELSESDPNDPCEVDPEAGAFADWQLVDGARLVLYPWPWSEVWLEPIDPVQWRNQLAYRIFDEERALPPGELLPWERHGVALGLLGYSGDGVLEFLDRFAVRRPGGRIGGGRPPVPGAGPPALWQARLQQFIEQVSDYDPEVLFGSEPLRPFLRFPPVGLLPRQAMNIDARVIHFFPAHFGLDAAPIPLGEVEAAIEDAVALSDVSTAGYGRLRILVPVPEALYEPALLLEEQPDPAFEEAIAEAILRRDQFLARRFDVRGKYAVLVDGLDGSALTFPSPDPEATEGEPDDSQLPPITGEPEKEYGTTVVANGQRRSIDVIDLEKIVPDGADEVLDQSGVEGLIKAMGVAIRSVEDGINLHFVRVQSDMYRLRQFVLDRGSATRLATSPLLANIAEKDSAAEYRKELVAFSEFLRPAEPTDPRFTFAASAVSAGAGASSPEALATAAPRLVKSTPKADTGSFASKLPADVFQPVAGLPDMLAPGGLKPVLEQEPALAQPIATKLQVTQLAANVLFQPKAVQFLGEFEAIQAEPLVLLPDFRHVNIAERIREPASKAAWSYAVATKYEVVAWVFGLFRELLLPIADFRIRARGYREGREENFVYLSELDDKLLQRFRTGDFNQPEVPDTGAQDEAAYVTAGVAALEESIAVLRQMEQQIEAFRAVVIKADKQYRRNLREHIAAVQKRLGELALELAEARHDLSVARVLYDEELVRVQRINERRQKTLDESVPYLVFHRLREVSAISEAPALMLPPAEVPNPVPACVEARVPAPPELARMIDVVREAPARWFPVAARLLDRLDALESMASTLQMATARARNAVALSPISAVPLVSAGLHQASITAVMTAQRQVVASFRNGAALRAVPSAVGRSWGQARAEADDVVSLGDLIDAGHGKSDVARGAAELLEHIYRVAACLYERFGEVLPAIRLQWAELLSQYDAAVDLHDLAALPRWTDSIEYIPRREMQMIVDWLYQQVSPTQADARAMVHDLVRVCILLASHAPVGRILTGRVEQATTTKIGGRVRIAVDASRVRVGTYVLLTSIDARPVRAVVQDLAGGSIEARIVDAPGQTVQLAADAVAQFVEPGSKDFQFLGKPGSR